MTNPWHDTVGKELMVGVDLGSPEGDKTVVSIREVDKFKVIGESIDLTIPLKNGWVDYPLKAIRVGELAIHQAIPDNGTEFEWCITHIPTLSCFDAVIPEGDYSQEQLISWCWKVQDSSIMKPSWDILNALTNKNYYRNSEPHVVAAKAAIQDWCLKVGVE